MSPCPDGDVPFAFLPPYTEAQTFTAWTPPLMYDWDSGLPNSQLPLTVISYSLKLLAIANS